MKRASFLTNVIMAALIIVLSGTLVFTMFSYRRQEQERTESLREEAERVRQEEENAEAEAEAERISQEEEAAAEAEAAGPFQISCRGESWQEDGADRDEGWPARLGRLLEEEEIDAEVSDYTWDMAGTLSQMRFAGVPEDTVQDYIDEHSRNGLRNVRIETVVRADLEEDYIEREDYEAIPVICVGYNGGYGRAMDELFEQQRLILETYDLREANAVDEDGEEIEYDDGDMEISGKYLILGHLPAGWNDLDNYNTRMTETWGDHYVSLNDIDEGLMSDAYRQEVAQIVYDKLEEMKYLER